VKLRILIKFKMPTKTTAGFNEFQESGNPQRTVINLRAHGSVFMLSGAL
jgi:hypothetical protein